MLINWIVTQANGGSKAALSNLRGGPVKGFVWPSLGFHYSKSVLYSDNLSLLW